MLGLGLGRRLVLGLELMLGLELGLVYRITHRKLPQYNLVHSAVP